MGDSPEASDGSGVKGVGTVQLDRPRPQVSVGVSAADGS